MSEVVDIISSQGNEWITFPTTNNNKREPKQLWQTKYRTTLIIWPNFIWLSSHPALQSEENNCICVQLQSANIKQVFEFYISNIAGDVLLNCCAILPNMLDDMTVFCLLWQCENMFLFI